MRPTWVSQVVHLKSKLHVELVLIWLVWTRKMVNEDHFGFLCLSAATAKSQTLVKYRKWFSKRMFRCLTTDEGLLYHSLVLKIGLYWFTLIFAQISIDKEALKLFIFVIPSMSFSKYCISSFQNKHWNVAKYTNQRCKIVTNLVYIHPTAWLFLEMSFNHFHCLSKNCFWHSINLRCCCSKKNRHRNWKQFSLAFFLFQDCLFN